eukprot:g2645.t1
MIRPRNWRRYHQIPFSYKAKEVFPLRRCFATRVPLDTVGRREPTVDLKNCTDSDKHRAKSARISNNSCDTSQCYQLLSFWKYHNLEDEEVKRWKDVLQNQLSHLDAKGRIIVSREGINAQLSLPSDHLVNLYSTLKSLHPSLPSLCTPDVLLSQKEYETYPPFNKLSIQNKKHLVNAYHSHRIDDNDAHNHHQQLYLSSAESSLPDLSDSTNPDLCGSEISPQKWHAACQRLQQERSRDKEELHDHQKQGNRKEKRIFMLDCRNDYESTLGKFKGAKEFDTFRYSQKFKSAANDGRTGCKKKTATTATTNIDDQITSMEDGDEEDGVTRMEEDGVTRMEEDGVTRYSNLHTDSPSTIQTRIDALLENCDKKNDEVLLYCTGGVRCVQVGAYLTQKQGYQNVKRLRGGINGYLAAHEVNQLGAGSDQEPSYFEGINYVFNNRIGELVSAPNDRALLSDNRRVMECLQSVMLREKESMQEEEEEKDYGLVQKNDGKLNPPLVKEKLPARERQKQTKREALETYIKLKERSRELGLHGSLLLNENHLGAIDNVSWNMMGENEKKKKVNTPPPRKVSDSPKNRNSEDGTTTKNSGVSSIETYCAEHSARETRTMELIREATIEAMPRSFHMLSGPLQGSVLKLLVSMMVPGGPIASLESTTGSAKGSTRAPTQVLELGTFTGYATEVFASCPNVGTVVSIDNDIDAHRLASRLLQSSDFFDKIHLRFDDVEAVLRGGVEGVFDLNSGAAYGLPVLPKESVMHPERTKSTTEPVTRSRRELGREPRKPIFDFVYMDADKKRTQLYYDLLFEKDWVTSGSIIFVDNTLWKGKVLDVQRDIGKENQVEQDKSIPSSDQLPAKDRVLSKIERRHRLFAKVMDEFNKRVANDPRVEVVLLPLRDGLSVIRVL